jgi:BlaI family penicillinase repressor
VVSDPTRADVDERIGNEMKSAPRIAEAEWKVMKVLWADPEPKPAYDIIQALSATQAWQPKTVKTLLNRLVTKGALGYRKYKNLYLYFPIVSETECLAVESESFLERFFGGSLRPMFAHFVEHHRLSRAHIEELKRILDRKGE